MRRSIHQYDDAIDTSLIGCEATILRSKFRYVGSDAGSGQLRWRLSLPGFCCASVLPGRVPLCLAHVIASRVLAIADVSANDDCHGRHAGYREFTGSIHNPSLSFPREEHNLKLGLAGKGFLKAR
ncbi:hypothetical protein [Dyella sp.]|uniref:hypothetical protein n=1 Tax=Dyella sp. TaxID=1869338 RepID=UPI002D76B80A|nr:hypothetical protein [Dyella sp.]HET7332332.1 hypothetical protein [Dyella sp.]